MPRFVPRERKHKRIARQGGLGDTNQEVISESQPSAKAVQRQPYLQTQSQLGKASAAKRKRLDKYIETKLKKEENAQLLQKIAQQERVDTGLLLSSKRLGRGVEETKRERLVRALKKRNLGVDAGGGGEAVLFERRRLDRDAEIGTDTEEEADENDKEGERDVIVTSQDNATTPSFGSGLKRPLDVNGSGEPVLRRRKRRRKEKLELVAHLESDSEDTGAVIGVNGHTSDQNSEISNEQEDEEEWNGFDSDAGSGSTGSDIDSGASHSGSVEENEDISDAEDNRPTRISAFKAWADSQRNASLNFTSSALPTNNEAAKASFKPRQLSPDADQNAPVLSANSEAASRPTATLTINRSPDVSTAREELPVVKEEQRIMETIYANPITIICGSTGSGKTTQVPQMLFEGGYGSLCGTSTASSSQENLLPSKGMIGITQPRRVATTSVADRVSHELGPSYGKRVAHQVRYDSNVSKGTAIKFMTDGILLREIQQDFPLSKYSVVIIDEAHERSVNTDILIGLLSRIVPLRAELAKEEPQNFCPLKLIIMSATLRIDDFVQNARLFRGVEPPVVEVEGRQFEVVEHFARRTRRDYVDEIVEKVARGHRKLPGGGMLVFLTGQEEIMGVERRLRERLGGGDGGYIEVQGKGRWRGADVDDFEDGVGGGRRDEDYLEPEDDGDAEDDGDEDSNADSETEIRLDDEDADFNIPDEGPLHTRSSKAPLKPHILPLYAALPANQQSRVFQPAPPGHRTIILATNVAETSLTIPGIRYVFDSGRSKEKRYNASTGIQTFEIDWISKASAEQRKGRAGRTGPGGHVWRLYSSAVYERWFEEHSVPEILRTPLESVVLQLKGLEIENVANFPFPTSPRTEDLLKAEKLLKHLGAIGSDDGKMTEMGKELVKFPVSPRFGKMLVLARKNGMVDFVAAVSAALAVGEVFVPPPHQIQGGGRVAGSGSEEEDIRPAKAETAANQAQHHAYTQAQAKLSRWDDHSDAVKLLTAVAAYAEAESTSKTDTAKKLCTDFFLREKGLSEVQQLRRQLHNILNSQQASSPPLTGFKSTLSLPTEKDRTMLNQLIAAGYIDQVAIRADLLDDVSTRQAFGRTPRRAIEVAYRTLIPIAQSEISPSATELEEELARSVFIHPSSVLAKLSVNEMPQYVVYSHLSRAVPSTIDDQKPQKKKRMHPLTAIGPKVLAVLAEGTSLLEYGKPIGKIEEVGMGRRICWVGVNLRDPDAGGATGWPLGAWKVEQRRRNGNWRLEKVISR